MPETAPDARWSVAPYFIVEDVIASANYYRDQLGFKYERFWGEPPCFAMVYRNGIVIMLSRTFLEAGVPPPALRARQCPNRFADPEGAAWDAYVWVDDADRLYQQYQAAGVKIARPLCDREYGCRDFEIEDLNGYRLCFGHNIERKATEAKK